MSDIKKEKPGKPDSHQNKPAAQSQVVRMEFTKKGKRTIIGIIAFFALGIGTLVFFLLYNPSQEGLDLDDRGVPRGNMVATADNLNDIQQELADRIARGMFETYMTTTWTFQNGESASLDAVMGNSASNNFPFWFTVTLQDTNEVVFTSGLIPLGKQMSEIKLDVPLSKGDYNAVISVNMIDENNQPVDNNVGFGIRIIVLN